MWGRRRTFSGEYSTGAKMRVPQQHPRAASSETSRELLTLPAHGIMHS